MGYVDVDNNEEFRVYDVISNTFKWEGKLDLAPPLIREDPSKLLIIHDNCLNLFARQDNNKGVTMFSLIDGSEQISCSAMHTNFIY